MIHVFLSMDILENPSFFNYLSFSNMDFKVFKIFFVFICLLYLLNFQLFLRIRYFQCFLFLLFGAIKEVIRQAGGYRLLGFYHLLSALLFILLLMTLGGFLPLLAPICTHPRFVWVVLLPIWFSTVYMSLKASFSGFLISLSPAGVPGYISPVLFFFEVVRILVRPVRLRLRLVANMVVGHILFS